MEMMQKITLRGTIPVYISIGLLLVCLSACAGTSSKSRIIALVDETPITEADLKHALSVSHRVQDLSNAKSLDLMSYVDKLIDEQLMVDEVRRMGLDADPAIEGKVKEYILRESVMKLHDEEVLSKVAVSDADIRKVFETSYISLGLIEVASKEEADWLVEEISKGAEFGALAAKHSSHVSKGRSGAVVYKREALTPVIVEALKGLGEGQVSAPVEIIHKWYIFRIEGVEEGFRKNFSIVKDGIGKELKKKFQKEREETVLERLRQKVPVKIDQQLFDSLDLDLIASQLDTWAADSRIIAWVGSEEVSVADFVNTSGLREKKPDKIRKKDDILKSLVNMKLIDIEARSRHYEKQPELAEQVRYYKEYEMRKLFFVTVILPSIDLSDQKVSDYYRKNIDLFKTEPLYRFQRIRLKTEAEAARVLANLNDGSDFFWTAKSKLSKEEWEEDMYTTWLTRKELPEDLKPQMDTLKIGDISNLIRTEGLFVIYRLKEKTDAQVKPYEMVRESVRKMVFDSQHEALRSEFARKLRSQSKIVIYDDEVAAIEGMISR